MHSPAKALTVRMSDFYGLVFSPDGTFVRQKSIYLRDRNKADDYGVAESIV